MNIRKKKVKSNGWKLRAFDEEKVVGRVYIYFLRNDLHDRPFGFVEDLFVKEDYRGEGLGTRLMEEVVGLAKERGCYKIVFTSRYGREKLHEFYKELGFEDFGKEFRMDLEKKTRYFFEFLD